MYKTLAYTFKKEPLDFEVRGKLSFQRTTSFKVNSVSHRVFNRVLVLKRIEDLIWFSSFGICR